MEFLLIEYIILMARGMVGTKLVEVLLTYKQEGGQASLSCKNITLSRTMHSTYYSICI